MALQFQQVSDYGTTNPVVARLSIQTKDLLPFFKISKNQEQEIFQVMFRDVQPKMMKCFRIKERIMSEVRAEQKKIDEIGIAIQADGRAYTLPTILDLREDAETFLYNAKSALRDFTEIFRVLLGKDFEKQARYDRVLRWAKQEFGDGHPISTVLQDDQFWIRRIVSMRNAVEHPGGHSGVLHVTNFTGQEEGKTVLVKEPVWYLNSEPEQPIAENMDVFATNLLTFYEEMLALSLEKVGPKFGRAINIAEVPESHRDPRCPVRFRAVLNP